MILVINYGTKHLKALLSFLRRHKISYKLRNFRRIELKDIKKSDALILTGGLGSPVKSKYSEGMNMVNKSKKPILGICLGFQIICNAYSSVIRKTRREDGIRRIKIKNQDNLFNNCPKIMRVSEHHEFFVEKVGKELEVLAVSKNGIEAVKHRTKPIYGVQFHPEVRKDNQGYKALENFLELIKKNNYFFIHSSKESASTCAAT